VIEAKKKIKIGKRRNQKSTFLKYEIFLYGSRIADKYEEAY